jgi:hypothetical protein
MTNQRHIFMNVARWMVPLAAAILSGCATEFDLSKGIPWDIGKVGTFETPMQVAAFWSDAVQTQPDKPTGIRGFGGRLYFYGKDPNKPVKVKGMLVVYAFDETNRDPKNVIPDKKYVFTPEQFQKKYSKSSLGDSYSIWLPWDEVGGPQKNISLVVRFTADKGEMITSDEAHQLLPGTTPEKKIAATDPNIATIAGQAITLPAVPPMPLGANVAAQSGVQAASYQQPTATTPGQPQTFSVMQTSTTSGVAQATATGAGQPDQNSSVDVSAAPDARMRTTTINVPQVPRPHFTVPITAGAANNTSYSGAGFSPGVQPQMAGPVNQFPVQNQIPVQNQLPILSPTQIPVNNSGQMYMPAQMPQVQNSQGQYGNANLMAPAMPGAMTPMASNGLPASAASQIANAAHSGLDKPRVLGAPIARLDSDRGQWPQSPGVQPSNLPSGPQLAPVQ